MWYYIQTSFVNFASSFDILARQLFKYGIVNPQVNVFAPAILVLVMKIINQLINTNYISSKVRKTYFFRRYISDCSFVRVSYGIFFTFIFNYFNVIKPSIVIHRIFFNFLKGNNSYFVNFSFSKVFKNYPKIFEYS